MTGFFVGLIERIDPSQAEMLRRQIRQDNYGQRNHKRNYFSVLLVVFSTLGGLIAVPIFEKRERNLPATAPPRILWSVGRTYEIRLSLFARLRALSNTLTQEKH